MILTAPTHTLLNRPPLSPKRAPLPPSPFRYRMRWPSVVWNYNTRRRVRDSRHLPSHLKESILTEEFNAEVIPDCYSEVRVFSSCLICSIILRTTMGERGVED